MIFLLFLVLKNHYYYYYYYFYGFLLVYIHLIKVKTVNASKDEKNDKFEWKDISAIEFPVEDEKLSQLRIQIWQKSSKYQEMV
jgi:hypothetical protein